MTQEQYTTTIEPPKKDNITKVAEKLLPLMPVIPEVPVSGSEDAEVVRPDEKGYYEIKEAPSTKLEELKERLSKIAGYYKDPTGNILSDIDSIEKLEMLEEKMKK